MKRDFIALEKTVKQNLRASEVRGQMTEDRRQRTVHQNNGRYKLLVIGIKFLAKFYETRLHRSGKNGKTEP